MISPFSSVTRDVYKRQGLRTVSENFKGHAGKAAGGPGIKKSEAGGCIYRGDRGVDVYKRQG